MKHIRMMIAGAALLAGSLAFGANQDAVALSDTQMDQVTGEYVTMFMVWNGNYYTMSSMWITNNDGSHGIVHFSGGPQNGQFSSW